MSELPTFQEAKRHVDAAREYLEDSPQSFVLDAETIVAKLAAITREPKLTAREAIFCKAIADLCISHYNLLRRDQ